MIFPGRLFSFPKPCAHPQLLGTVPPAVRAVDGQPHGQPDEEPDPGGQGELHHQVDVDEDGQAGEDRHQGCSEGQLLLITRLQRQKEHEKAHEDSAGHSK